MERIDIIPGTDYKIIQNKEKFSYGTDAIFLSSFARPKGVTMDLGTGTGIIALRLYGLNKLDKVYAVEIQEEMVAMAKRSVELNKLEDRIEILHMDLKDLGNFFKKASIDTIVTNPPYMKAGGALLNPDENFALSRHELACSLEDIVAQSAYLLKPLGRFFMVHRPDRLVDIIYQLRSYNIEPKYLQFVHPGPGKKPNLVLIEAVKLGKPDLKFHQPLIVYKEDGSYTEDLLRIYGRAYEIDK